MAGTVMNALRSGESGVFRFRTSDHKPYYLSYGPTGVNGWMTVTILPSSLFMTFSDWYVILMLGSLLTALAVFGAFSFSCCAAPMTMKSVWRSWL